MTETKSVSLDNETNNEPNNFILSGVGQHKDVRINYSTTSFRNVPIFSYNDSKDTYYFMGSEIRAQETEIGTMVTVTEMYYPHQCEIMLTLLVPDINLDGDCSEQEFETIAIRTTSKSTYIGQQGVKGAVQSYEVIHLNGTANIVYP
ncbi:hypothetical protein [Methanosarcina sp.]|uniref:hypothetical protein n=1 Tax=Methanosarcina sp. TaxID=2213 RepID=UPI003C76A5F9